MSSFFRTTGRRTFGTLFNWTSQFRASFGSFSSIHTHSASLRTHFQSFSKLDSSKSLQSHQIVTMTGKQNRRSYSTNANQESTSSSQPQKRNSKWIWGIAATTICGIGIGIKKMLDQRAQERIQRKKDREELERYLMPEEDLRTLSIILDITDATKLDREQQQARCFEAVIKMIEEKNWDKISSITNFLSKLVITPSKSTVVQALIDKGSIEAAKELFEKFPEEEFLYQKDIWGNNALHAAAKQGDPEFVRFLLKDFIPFEENRMEATPISIAIARGHEKVLRMLVDRGTFATKPESLSQFLIEAIKHKKIDCFVALLAGSDDKECKQLFNRVDLTIPSERWRRVVSALDLTLERVKWKGSILHAVATFCDTEATDRFFKVFGSDIAALKDIGLYDTEGFLPLHRAAKAGNERIIWWLAKLGFPMNEYTKDGQTAVFLATVEGKPKVIDMLWEMGADLTKRNQDKALVYPDKPATAMEAQDALPLQRKCLARLLQYAGMVAKNKNSPPNYALFPPQYLVLKGGGSKGIAHVGGLYALEEKNIIEDLKGIAGTSAGAIMAGLIATGHSPKEIEGLMKEKDFNSFLDLKNTRNEALIKALKKSDGLWSSIFAVAWDVAKSGPFLPFRVYELYQLSINATGLAKGDEFRTWMEEQIGKKTGITNCTFAELKKLRQHDPKKYKQLQVYAVDVPSVSANHLVALSASKKYDDVIISDAIRASMSIPWAFEPHILHTKNEEGRRVERKDLGRFVDGGMLRNLPTNAFDHAEYMSESEAKSWGQVNKRTIGFSLRQSKVEGKTPVPDLDSVDTKTIAAVFTAAQEILETDHEYDAGRIATIQIPPDIRLIDFQLTEEQTKGLMEAGKKAVKEKLEGKS